MKQKYHNFGKIFITGFTERLWWSQWLKFHQSSFHFSVCYWCGPIDDRQWKLFQKLHSTKWSKKLYHWCHHPLGPQKNRIIYMHSNSTSFTKQSTNLTHLLLGHMTAILMWNFQQITVIRSCEHLHWGECHMAMIHDGATQLIQAKTWCHETPDPILSKLTKF